MKEHSVPVHTPLTADAERSMKYGDNSLKSQKSAQTVSKVYLRGEVFSQSGLFKFHNCRGSYAVYRLVINQKLTCSVVPWATPPFDGERFKKVRKAIEKLRLFGQYGRFGLKKIHVLVNVLFIKTMTVWKVAQTQVTFSSQYSVESFLAVRVLLSFL